MSRIPNPAGLLLVLSLSLVSSGLMAQQAAAPGAGAAPQTRQQVRMERKDFLATHEWDEANDTWRLRKGFEPPAGVKSRDEVRAARDAWILTHRWDNTRGGWVSRDATPRAEPAKTREQVRADTRRFMRTHRWDEATETWVDRGASARPM